MVSDNHASGRSRQLANIVGRFANMLAERP